MKELQSPGGPPRWRVRVRGLVQGVGFRPFIYELAGRLQLTGWVQNDQDGVLAEVQGQGLPTFLEALRREPPPLSRIEGVECEPLPSAASETGFVIRESARTGVVSTAIIPDAAPCRDCLSELFDPSDRRYLYPFLNCTHCGPRFTITAALPYDRRQTSMSHFRMCTWCANEYEDPKSRRFHAQPNACPDCGPTLSMSVTEVVRRLGAGEIVAVKAVGGFQLACDAKNAAAVARLRRDKERDEKPFAVMVANAASAARYVELTPTLAEALSSTVRPIVVAQKGTRAHELAPGIAPRLASLGVMLPSSPLHYLLFHEALGRPSDIGWLAAPADLAFVMTSANRGGEPLITSDLEASSQLVGVADAICGHDRAIVVRCDDPVVQLVDGVARTVRRGRGAVPRSIRLPAAGPTVLATGASLKSAVCVTRGAEAYLSQHIGDLDNSKTYAFFEETIAHLLSILDVTPVAVAHDLHPDFLSTEFAERLSIPCLPVQHHHAHLAAVLAEHGIVLPRVGLALDGMGLGPDGTAWGGELLRISGARYERLGHLASLPLPGGDRAAREPWRMALAVLLMLGETTEIERRWGANGVAVLRSLGSQVNAPRSSACGRWFDAAAGLLGVCHSSSYEGEAPRVLESLVREPRVVPGGFRIQDGALDLLPLFRELQRMPPEEGAEAFHGTLAAGLVELALPWVAREREIAVGGGCAMNAVLVASLVRGFGRHGVRVLLPREAPAGDGGLALGQAWICGRAIESGWPSIRDSASIGAPSSHSG